MSSRQPDHQPVLPEGRRTAIGRYRRRHQISTRLYQTSAVCPCVGPSRSSLQGGRPAGRGGQLGRGRSVRWRGVSGPTAEPGGVYRGRRSAAEPSGAAAAGAATAAAAAAGTTAAARGRPAGSTAGGCPRGPDQGTGGGAGGGSDTRGAVGRLGFRPRASSPIPCGGRCA